MANPKIQGGFNLPFAEQVEFFRNKLNLPTERWDDLLHEAHDRSFVVAGAMKADLLDDLRRAVDKAIEKGTGLEEFRRQFKEIVQKNGWTGWTGEGTKAGEAWRTRVIWETNLASSRAAGRYKQLTDPELLARRPYWKYIHSDSVLHPRPQHLAWNGMVLPHDHPFWQTHFPPNGWGCGCRVTAVRSPKEGDKTTPPEGWDAISPKTGAPQGIDKGWAYVPGKSVTDELRGIVAGKIETLPAELGAALGAATMQEASLAGATDSAFAEFFDKALANRARPTGAMMVVGAFKPEWVEKMKGKGIAPATAEIAMRDNDVAHTFRDAKNSPVTTDLFRNLPRHLRNPKAVILDNTHATPAMLIILDGDQRKAKVMIQIDYLLKKPKRGTFNLVNTGREVDADALLNLKRELQSDKSKLELLEGEL